MKTKSQFNWLDPVKDGALGGILAIYVALIGMVNALSQRDIIGGVISMGHTLLLLAFLYAAYRAVNHASQAQASSGGLLASGALAGLVAAAMVALLVFVGPPINLRAMFINASPEMYAILTFNQSGPMGIIILLAVGASLGLLTAGLTFLPAYLRRAVVIALVILVLAGLLQELLTIMVKSWGPLQSLFLWMFGKGLSIPGAITLFILIVGWNMLWAARGAQAQQWHRRQLPATRQTLRWASLGLVIVLMLLLPGIVGSYPSEVIVNVGLFALMGLGLNIVVGFAGLLDLGYVAFFAIGAYIMGVFTSPEIGWQPLHTSFWGILLFAVIGALAAGVMLGIPVLGMRGDYLAIVTLGFGEIIRLVALSDWLKPYIGGSNGITGIPKPIIGPIILNSPQSLYYLVIAGCVLVGFVAWRLKDSRLGRAWMALREDEDVAEATGIHLVSTKLLAFAAGAAFSGLAGAIFASKLTSIYPHSFDLMKSINALCLIIVGGIGSIPGVIVGALILVGVPELLREFAEYRMLMYGALLVIMMLTKPEGFWPEATHQRELHEEQVEPVETGITASG